MSIHKIAASTLLSMEALLGWMSSGYLLAMSYLTSTQFLSQVTEWAALVFGVGTGLFTTLRFIETYRVEKIKRKQEELRLKKMEDEYPEDQVTGV